MNDGRITIFYFIKGIVVLTLFLFSFACSSASDNEIDVNVLRLWQLVRSIKWDLLPFIERYDEIDCSIDDEECDHEGYVMTNEFGTFKIVDRDIFSRSNFLRVRD